MNKLEDDAIHKEFERLKSIAQERKTEEKLQVADICNFYTFIHCILFVYKFKSSLF